MANVHTDSLNRLMEQFRKLPGIGPRTAERLAYHVLKQPAEEALALARQIAQGPASVHCAKQAMFHAAQLPLKEALLKDSEIYGEVYKTKDFKEGVTAFLEKRKPVFKNE